MQDILEDIRMYCRTLDDGTVAEDILRKAETNPALDTAIQTIHAQFDPEVSFTAQLWHMQSEVQYGR